MFAQLEALDFVDLVWLLPAAVSLHMLEEMIWLPAWSKTAGKWHKPVTPRQFALASILLLLILFAVALLAARSPKGSLFAYIAAGLALTFLLNIYQPHLGSMLDLKRYAPGLVTGLLFNLPLMSLIIWQAVSDGYLNGLVFLVLALPLVFVFALGWELLLYTGSILLK